MGRTTRPEPGTALGSEGAEACHLPLQDLAAIPGVTITYLAVPISAGDVAGAMEQVSAALEGGAEMLELRPDYLEGLTPEMAGEQLAAVRTAEPGVPVIATCRDPREGGTNDYPEDLRLKVLAAAVDALAFARPGAAVAGPLFAQRRPLLAAVRPLVRRLGGLAGPTQAPPPSRVKTATAFRPHPTIPTPDFQKKCLLPTRGVRIVKVLAYGRRTSCSRRLFGED